MKILYFIKDEPAGAVKDIMAEHKKSNEVTEIDIRKNKNYAEIVDKIANSEKVIAV